MITISRTTHQKSGMLKAFLNKGAEEQLKVFFEKIKADTSLQEKLKGAASPEAAIEFAKAAGFSITSEDIQSMQSATVELSDNELEGAAGGAGPHCCHYTHHIGVNA